MTSTQDTTPARAEAHPLGRLVPEEITDEDRAWAASEIEKIKDMPSPWEDRPNLDRAEAQDEGAAGERGQTDCKRCAGNGEIVTDWDRYLGAPQPGDQGDEGTTDCPDCDGTGKVDVTEDHPSPTPAADADRVRIACEKEAIAGALGNVLPLDIDWQHIRVASQAFVEALAALKSTAAKEGGES